MYPHIGYPSCFFHIYWILLAFPVCKSLDDQLSSLKCHTLMNGEAPLSNNPISWHKFFQNTSTFGQEFVGSSTYPTLKKKRYAYLWSDSN